MSADTAPVHRLTREIVAIGGPLASLVSHMQHSAAANGRDPAGVTAVLAELVEPVLTDLTEGWSEERILDAADVLHAACERVCSEIFIVSPPKRAQRRARRR